MENHRSQNQKWYSFKNVDIYQIHLQQVLISGPARVELTCPGVKNIKTWWLRHWPFGKLSFGPRGAPFSLFLYLLLRPRLITAGTLKP